MKHSFGKNELEFFKDLFQNSSELIHSLNEEGRFLWVNDAWLRTMGYHWDELKNKTIWELMQDDTIPQHRTRFQEVLKGSIFTRNQMILRSRYGTYIVLEGSSRANFNEEGEFISTQGIFRDVTTEQKQHRTMKHTLSRLQALLTQSPSGILLFDEAGTILEVSDSVGALLEKDRQTLIGTRMQDHFDAHLSDALMRDIGTLKDTKQPIIRQDVLSFGKGKKTLESRLFPVSTEQGESGIFGAIVNDITTEKRLEETLYTEKELFRTTLMSVGDGIISTDEEGRILMLNPVAEQLTGWTLQEAKGRSLDEVFAVYDDLRKPLLDNPARRVLRTGEISKLENHTWLISKQGEEVSIEDVAAPIKDRDGHLTGVVLVFRDVREKLQRQQQIEYLSFHDHLTGLYNRRYMEDALQRLDTQRNLPLTIMVLDVNGLKLTNDAFGHQAGDELLVRVSQILKNVCRSDDLIGRIGGDEFLILFPNTDQESAELIKQRINRQAEQERSGSVIVSIAIGYAVKMDPQENVQVVQQNADNSMFRDKIQFGKSMKTGTIRSVMKDLYQKFQNEEQHIHDVAILCEKIGRKLGFSDPDVELLKNAATVHDVGKIIIPEQILNKPDLFTEDEFELVRRHPETSYQILKSVEDFAMIADIALHHHERWDGKGYPRGLSGKDIPLMSRILSIADAYEAMTSPRTYREKRTMEEAIQELRRCSGSQFDPELVEVLISQVLSDISKSSNVIE